MTDNKNNNLVVDKDDDPTIELEPLCEEDCAKLACAAESADTSGLVVKRNEARRPDVDSESLTQEECRASDHGSQDALTLGDEGGRFVEPAPTEQREDYHELVRQVARLQATNAKISEKLDKKSRELANSKTELEQLRGRERQLLTELSEFRKSAGRDVAAADQGYISEDPERQNDKLTGSVSPFEEQLDLAKSQSRQPRTRPGEAANACGTRDGEEEPSRPAPAINQESSRWVLVSLDDSSTGTVRLSEGIVTVGSSPENDIHIQSPFISRQHAHFESTHKACVVGDLNSTNGTFVNSRRITKRMLRAGDVVTFGKHRFRCEEQSAASGHEQIKYDPIEHSRTH